MLMSGKMSTGVRINTTGVSRIIASAITTNVYGLRSANRTIHIECQFSLLHRRRLVTTNGLLVHRRFNLDSWEHLFGYGPYWTAVHVVYNQVLDDPRHS